MAIGRKTRRLQVTLRSSTVDMIDELKRDGYLNSRSAFLDEAARHHATRLKRAHLKRQLRSGYRARVRRDAELNQDWEAASPDALPE